MNFKGLFIGVVLVLLIGVGGFLYRSMEEEPHIPAACTADAHVCPDGTAVGRTGPACTFAPCLPPNVELTEAEIAFALPAGYVATETYSSDPAVMGAYVKGDAEDPAEVLLIRRYTPSTEQSVAEFIRENAVLDPSGLPAPPTAFTSSLINGRRYSVVQIGRFEGVVTFAYYLSRESEVVRFDAISRHVMNWTDSSLDVSKLTAHQDLKTLLSTLQGK